MQIILIIFLFILGAVMGSFVACQVRRMQIRERDYTSDRSRGAALQAQKPDVLKTAKKHRSTERHDTSKDAKKPTSAKVHQAEAGHASLGARSVCLHCHRQLRWYDNIPVISWLVLRGRCRDCGADIGRMEIISEVGLGAVFVMLGMSVLGFWGAAGMAGVFPGVSDIVQGCVFANSGTCVTSVDLALTIQIIAVTALFITVTGLWLLLLYDASAGRLPVKTLTFCIICAIIERLGLFSLDFLTGVDNVMTGMEIRNQLLSLLGAIVILPGTYFAFYKVSHERWVGGGDWILCVSLALILGEWWLALLTLFFSNFLGSALMLPGMMRERGTTKSGKAEIPSHQVPFAPFLIIATFLVVSFQGELMALLSSM